MIYRCVISKCGNLKLPSSWASYSPPASRCCFGLAPSHSSTLDATSPLPSRTHVHLFPSFFHSGWFAASSLSLVLFPGWMLNVQSPILHFHVYYQEVPVWITAVSHCTCLNLPLRHIPVRKKKWENKGLAGIALDTNWSKQSTVIIDLFPYCV